jgi:hypothetical protein
VPLASRRTRAFGLILVAFFATIVAACAAPGPSPNSPEVNRTYQQMYSRPIVGGG